MGIRRLLLAYFLPFNLKNSEKNKHLPTRIMRIQVFSLLVLGIISSCHCDSIDSNVVNAKVERKIDIATHLVKTATTITIENKGSSAVSSYLLAFPSTVADRLSFISASSKEKEKLKVAKASVSGQSGKSFFKVQLKPALDAGKTSTIEVEAIF